MTGQPASIRMPLIPRVIALCCAMVSAHSLAAPVSDLYKVREPVASQQPAEREEALRKAFDTLVLRLTGDPKTDQAAVAQLRKDPQQLISRYAYEDGAVVVVPMQYNAVPPRLLQEMMAAVGKACPLVCGTPAQDIGRAYARRRMLRGSN